NISQHYHHNITKNGSPLQLHTRAQAEALQAVLPDHEVTFAMRYGNPSLGEALKSLQSRGVEQITLVPMYPQYARASTGTTVEHFENPHRPGSHVGVRGDALDIGRTKGHGHHVAFRQGHFGTGPDRLDPRHHDALALLPGPADNRPRVDFRGEREEDHQRAGGTDLGDIRQPLRHHDTRGTAVALR
ncbi:MAG: ferrochelatase, partial [Planctomycetota bacterium]|nr:ferrochelatase [Planctomycetota bacterium]